MIFVVFIICIVLCLCYVGIIVFRLMINNVVLLKTDEKLVFLYLLFSILICLGPPWFWFSSTLARSGVELVKNTRLYLSVISLSFTFSLIIID